MNEVSTNLEQGQGYIEDDVQTLEERGELDVNTETSRGKTIMFLCISRSDLVEFQCVNVYQCIYL